MRTTLSDDNPLGYTRYGFAWEHVDKAAGAHLDFGCGRCMFLNELRAKHIGRLIGVDVSQEAVEHARRQFPDLEIAKIDDATKLQFEDRLFDSITLLDVIEHVYEQRELLGEFGRVLKDDGRLIVTVPGQHLFSFADLGNLKFRFPRLHRWFYVRRHGREEYERRYGSNADGLIGDVSAKKRWHEHFSRSKMAGLLAECGFEVQMFDGAGFFCRLLHNMQLLVGRIGPVGRLLKRLENADRRAFNSTHLFCVAVKKGHGQPFGDEGDQV